MPHMDFETTVIKCCELCHHTERAKLSIYIKDDWYDNKRNFKTKMIREYDDNDEVVEGDVRFVDRAPLPLKCEKCGSKRTILLDERIGDVIAKLNEKGYVTSYSCDGKVSKDEISYPYIQFSSFSTPIDIFASIPEGWEVYVDADLYTIFDYPGPAMYYKESTGTADIEWDKDALMKWVESLPYNDIGLFKARKKPGERYELNDIKQALIDTGCDVTKFKAAQVDERWIVYVEFGNGLPSIGGTRCITASGNDSMFISLKSLSTDDIYNIVHTIYYTRSV